MNIYRPSAIPRSGRSKFVIIGGTCAVVAIAIPFLIMGVARRSDVKHTAAVENIYSCLRNLAISQKYRGDDCKAASKIDKDVNKFRKDNNIPKTVPFYQNYFKMDKNGIGDNEKQRRMRYRIKLFSRNRDLFLFWLLFFSLVFHIGAIIYVVVRKKKLTSTSVYIIGVCSAVLTSLLLPAVGATFIEIYRLNYQYLVRGEKSPVFPCAVQNWGKVSEYDEFENALMGKCNWWILKILAGLFSILAFCVEVIATYSYFRLHRELKKKFVLPQ